MKRRVCVIGLDGVPYTFLKEMFSKGHLPNLRELFGNGNLRQMSVSIPEVSSVSWTSFMTGENSGNHGIYGFMDFKEGSRKVFFPNSHNIQSPPIWEYLSKMGKKSLIINLPSTYPAKPLNGILVSGFVAPELTQAVFPASYIKKLRDMDYRLDVRADMVKGDMNFLFKELYETLDKRFEAFQTLNREIDWDFFLPVVTETDRLNHFLWGAYENTKDPYHQRFVDFHNTLDRYIGELLQNLPTGTIIMALSDHGFTKTETEVNLNYFLYENGFQEYNQNNPQYIDDLTLGSKAFALDPSRIYLNKSSRFINGCVKDEDIHEVTENLQGRLKELNFNGSDVFSKIYRAEEIYSGKCLHLAPDLTCLSNYGFNLKGKLTGKSTFEQTVFSGMHTQDDAFIFSTFPKKLPESIFKLRNYILETFTDN